MYKGKLAHKQITKSTDHFEVDDMLCPNFVNNGETVAVVFFQPVYPGDQFPFNLPQLILTGTIPVQFISEPGKKDLLDVYFGTTYDECN